MSFVGVSFISVDGPPSTPSAAPAAITAAATNSAYSLVVVDGYSRTKETIKNGDWLESPPFRVGDHCWLIQYSPNGIDSEVADYISLHLVLVEDNVAEAVKVQFEFSLVDKTDEKQLLLPSVDIHESEVSYFNSTDSPSWGYDAFMKREDLEKSAHLKNDRLTIKCDVVVTQDVHVENTPLVLVPASDMHQHISSILQSGEGSDVTFEVGGEIFAAHRCVLGCRSTVFKGLLSGSIKEGTNTTTAVVPIDDMEARVFKLLLGFIYSDTVQEMEEEEDDDVMWQHLLVAADRYDLVRLRMICEQKLCTYINTTTAATILALAERHHGQGLKDACLDFLIRDDANLQEVVVLGGLDHLATTSPLVLKDLIVKFASPNKKAKIDVNTTFVEVPASDVQQHFSRLLKSDEGTDVVFEVSGEKLHAHRCVLAARSAVFRAELYGPMKEGTTTAVIRIDDMEARVFKLLLTFIYSDSVPDDINEEDEEYDDEEDMEGEGEGEEDVDDAVTWQQLLVAADRYDLLRLRLICEQKLRGYINASRLASILELAEQRHCQGLKQACLNYLNSPPNLQQVMAAGGLNQLLSSSCPSVLIDLIAKLAYLKPDN